MRQHNLGAIFGKNIKSFQEILPMKNTCVYLIRGSWNDLGPNSKLVYDSLFATEGVDIKVGL